MNHTKYPEPQTEDLMIVTVDGTRFTVGLAIDSDEPDVPPFAECVEINGVWWGVPDLASDYLAEALHNAVAKQWPARLRQIRNDAGAERGEAMKEAA